MGFSAFIQYIDKNKKIKVFSTNYAKWTCEGLVPARFYSNKFSLSSITTTAKSIEKESLMKNIVFSSSTRKNSFITRNYS